MILEKGGNARSMPFVDVLNEWHPGIVKLFLKHGADFKTNSPFAEAFAGRRRTVLGIFRSLLETDPTIIDQATQALIYHVRKGSEKWVLLMLWLGADPSAPTIDPDYPQYPEDKTTALSTAVSYGRIEVLKKFHIDPVKDDILDLLDDAAIAQDPAPWRRAVCESYLLCPPCPPPWKPPP
jgi:hypothetical protein